LFSYGFERFFAMALETKSFLARAFLAEVGVLSPNPGAPAEA
jgi:hypothetical protein